MTRARRMSACAWSGVVALVLVSAPGTVAAQAPAAPPVAAPGTQPGVQAAGPELPPGYVIGPADQLQILYWDNPKMSVDAVVVRPDGMISLPLLNDVSAVGLAPDQLREKIAKLAMQFVEGPNVQVIVREINSRRVYITGMVSNPGYYPLIGPTSVVQLIATAGGLLEYAKQKDIRILRQDNGRQQAYRFNYDDLERGRNLSQNIELRPGDTVIVP